MIATAGVGAVVVAPEDDLTYVADQGGSRIDVFVISKTLAPLVKGIEVDKDASIKGRRPVHLRLSKFARTTMVHVLRRPPKCPAGPVVGPRVGEAEFLEIETEFVDLKECGTYNPERLNGIYLRWARVASTELTANLGAP
eukprot:7391030-Lingulodinium_polyedra.AAC.1